MDMKKIFLSLAAALCMTTAQAYDYAYLVLQKADGSTVKVSTSGISLSFNASSAQLTVGNTAYSIADLRYMYFTNSETNENVVAIPSLGWATFCSTSPLNYTEVNGLTAYTATFTDTEARLHQLADAVPAGTGVVLKGEEGTYHVPVAASASAPASNDLSGTTSDLTTTADKAYFALAQIDDTSVGFKLVSTGVVIPAGKAYYATDPATARLSYILVEGDDDTTAIDNLSSATADAATIAEADAIYDLRGHEVNRSASGTLPKGVYIIKKGNQTTKVIVK